MNSSLYSLIRCDRNTPRQKRGGGVCLFVHKSLLYKEIYSQSEVDSHELLIVDVMFSVSLTVRFCIVYRTPALSRSLSEAIWKNIADKLLCPHPVVLTGDFNFPEIDWNIRPPACSSNTGRDFLDFCTTFSFEQSVSKPTRGPAFLDLLFSNEHNLVKNVETMPPFDGADHDSIFFALASPNSIPQFKMIADFENANYEMLNHVLSVVDWNKIFRVDDSVDLMYEKMLTILNLMIEFHVPRKMLNLKGKNYPEHIQRHFRARHSAWLSFQASQTAQRKNTLKNKSDLCTKALEKYHGAIEKKLLSGSDKRKFYAYMNRMNNKTETSVECLIDTNG